MPEQSENKRASGRRIEDANQSISWRKIDHDLEFRSTILPRVIALWHSRKMADRLPGRSDFDALDLMAFKGHLALIDVEHDPERFRFRLIGTAITEVLGRDATGMFLDELYSAATYGLAVEGYRYCVATRLPAKASGQMVHANKDFVPFESVDLPLASDGFTVDMILKAADFVS